MFFRCCHRWVSVWIWRGPLAGRVFFHHQIVLYRREGKKRTGLDMKRVDAKAATPQDRASVWGLAGPPVSVLPLSASEPTPLMTLK